MVYTLNLYRNTWQSDDVQICDVTTLIDSTSMRFEQKPEVGEEVFINGGIYVIHNFRYSIHGITILCVQNGLQRLRIVWLRSVGTGILRFASRDLLARCD